MSFASFLLQTATGAAAGDVPQQSILMTVLPFILIIIIFYFFIIRPQNKKQKETQKMIDALKKGDKVVTIGGIHGVVASTKEKTVIVKVDDSTKIEFSRSAISAVEGDKSASAKDAKPAKAEKRAESKAENAAALTTETTGAAATEAAASDEK